jgi:lysophospholipase L1-like esterase
MRPSGKIMDSLPAVAPSFRRVQNLFLWTAVAVCVLIVVDNLSLRLTTGLSPAGPDRVLAGLAGAFLVVALLLRNVGRRLAVPLVATICVLVPIEGGLSVWSLTQPRRFPWYVWPPHYSCLVKPADLPGVAPQGRFTTNSLGIRGPEFNDTDTCRILCVGGSATECFYLDDAKTWPAVLMRILGDDAPGVWVGNAGSSGTTAPQHALLLEQLPEARMVDCWVVLCGINDLGQQLNGRYARITANGFAKTFRYRRPGLGGHLRRPLHRNLFTFTLFENACRRVRVALKGGDATIYQDVKATWVKQQQRKRQRAVKIAADIRPEWLEEYQAQLTRMVRLARRWDKRLIFMTQPTIWVERMDEKTDAMTLGGQLLDGRFADGPTRVRGMELYNQAMRDLAVREGVELVDLAAKLPKTTEAFYDDCHFNENGAWMVATALAEQVKTRELKAGAQQQ